MGIFIRVASLVIVVGLMSGCGSGAGAKSAAPAGAAQGDKVARTKAWVMPYGGANVLRLTLAADIKCTAADGVFHINTSDYEVEVWLARDAHTVDDAIAHLDKQIVTEFKELKVSRTTDLTVAGSPAKRLVGSGFEADDGDAGNADVIVFKVGDHVFVACTHGERLLPAAQEGMFAMVQTAQMP